MIYDYTGKPLPETDGKAAPAKPETTRMVMWGPEDRIGEDASRALTPTRLDMIFRAANIGFPRDQAKFAEEIEEKDPDVPAHLQTRRLAVQGLDWDVVPTDEGDATAVKIAEAACDMLHGIGSSRATVDYGEGVVDLEGAIEDCLGAILPGYSLLEVLWGPGGKTVAGFVPVARRNITFTQSLAPLIVSRSNGSGAPLAPNKFWWHTHHVRSGDATRGGLIRPLGWMYLFSSLGIKDLMRFTEKFGMPFVSARIDETAWDKDRLMIQQLIRNFGSDGGACFSKAVELELLNGAASGGDVYFLLLKHFDEAKTKVILGQLASSGRAGGMSKGQMQENVRDDILRADCKAVAASLRRCVLAPWTAFNFGPDAPVPEFEFDLNAEEDLKAASEVVLNLSNAGYSIDPEQIKERFGYDVVAKAAPAPAPDGSQNPESRIQNSDAMAMRDHRIFERRRSGIG